ncbi:adenylate/guanylate cyclase domain-containing protein [Spirulina sp. 06S082]|uniref:adenylate/guanylate cyclase domain-containing protein n=1 Tax=Spirulina sp. 06S082 TaxID=3110248 RepID=UPI002B2036AB|nr:adenylate/guanylate cyclase domain-containing protein [Spirulina sp. 06S082]MEA5467967.1 adenylate/guanylate cyclase domain-containing protein [Spirulina sp. 06S082]
MTDSVPNPQKSLETSSGDILAVDDAPNNLRILSSLLSKKGYRVRSVISGEMALKAAQSAPPDLILLDINLPRMDGYEVCQKLKDNEITRDIPVIFISALSDVLDKVKAFAVGGVDYITKPFQFAEVVVRVENQLRLRRLQKELELQNTQLVKENRDRITAEAALQGSEAELRALFAAMDDIILVFDRQGTCLKIAPTKSDRSLLETQHSGNLTVRDLFPPEQAALHLHHIQEVLQTRQTVTAEYYLPINYNKRWFSANVSLLSEDTVIWVARDITASKEAESALREQKARSEQLLLNILPEPIAKRLQAEESTIADKFDEVTVLFADLVNFTEISTQLSSIELVEILNVIFSDFDYLAQRHGLEKIKTIGDAYMAVAGLPYPKSDGVEASANMALDLLKTIDEFNAGTGKKFALRVGLHVGPVVAGVIGVSKFIYDLWGDTVNIASRMESQGLPHQIQVTRAVYDVLHESYLLEEREAITVKGKGEMITYWLRGKK